MMTRPQSAPTRRANRAGATILTIAHGRGIYSGQCVPTIVWQCLLILLALCAGKAASASDDYTLGPDSMPQTGVPRGEISHYSLVSKVFPGTTRNYNVYVPKQYDPGRPACVMFFQDGGGGFNVSTVFDNLIFKKQMPVTVAVMIPPGVVPAASANALPRFNRSHEYDGMSGDYARFLVDEVIPDVSKHVNISKDPNDRGLCGASSGGIAAFTAAWQQPDQFRRVISFVGSFTDLQGGNLYNSLIRKMEPRPLRVFLQDGSNDQDIYSGSWPNANKDVYDALKYSGYDAKFVLGDGPHSGRHGASILPDVLRWLWRDYPRPIVQPSTARWPLAEAWIPGENWKATGIGGRIGGLASGSDGAVWMSLPGENRVQCVGSDGRVDQARSVTALRAPGALAFGPGGELWISEPANRRIVRRMPGARSGRERIAVRDAVASHMVVNHRGEIYYTDDRDGKIYHAAPEGPKQMVSADVTAAGPLTLTPDQTLLIVTPSRLSKWGYSLQIKLDGGLAYCQEYFDLHVPYGAAGSGTTALAVDTNGWLYAASDSGIQMLDQAGRVNGILASPAPGAVEHLAFGGQARTTMYLVQGGQLYRRTLKAVGAQPYEPPIKPPAPRL